MKAKSSRAIGEKNILVFKRALGVTTGILPWNFLVLPDARKLAPALITGNTIVIKPSEFPQQCRRVCADCR